MPAASHVLETLQARELSILQLSEPIASSSADPSAGPSADRTSDVSSLDAPTPASLEADLAHYRELFAKLRFSYVEQVTKEKFIRAIVGDPPLIVAPRENAALEASNAAAKAQLQALKAEVADMVADLEARGCALSRRYDEVRAQTAVLAELPAQVSALEEEVARLGEAQEQDPAVSNPELRLPLSRTLELVDERRARRAELDRQLEQLASQVPRKRKEAERLQNELQPLEARRQNGAAAAREARKRKEAALGGAEDELEERGRWWRASETMLRGVLGGAET